MPDSLPDKNQVISFFHEALIGPAGLWSGNERYILARLVALQSLKDEMSHD